MRSRLRLRWLALRGRATVGRDTHVGPDLLVRVAPGAHLHLGDGVRIGHSCRLLVHGGELRLEPNATLDDRVMLTAHERIVIGEDAHLGDAAAVSDAAFAPTTVERATIEQGLRIAPVEIGAYADIGPRAVVEPGVTIGARARVGAQAVADRDVPAGATVSGVPARSTLTRPAGVAQSVRAAES